MERIKDYLLMEEELVSNQERLKPQEEKAEDGSKVDNLQGTPMSVGSLEELIGENHAIVSSLVGPEYCVGILSFVDKDQLEPGCAILMQNKDEVDPMVSVMKVEKAPLESYADIGGLDAQIQEIKEAVELPLTHPELYEDIGIKPPKGVILYGEPGTGKTLLAKAVANSTSATFLRVVSSELIQKYPGDGPKLVRELFRVADDLSSSIVFSDEIDAVGTKRYDAHSGGEHEIQRTMLEFQNELDGFDSRGDAKVILATNKVESLDPALLQPEKFGCDPGSVTIHRTKFSQKTHYETMGVKEDASHEEIRKIYRMTILDCHPDKQLHRTSETSSHNHGSGNEFLEVQRAWEILSDPRSRARYDIELQILRQSSTTADDLRLQDMAVEVVGDCFEFSYHCRCGDLFLVDSFELEEMGCTFLRIGSKVSLCPPVSLPASIVLPCGSCSTKVGLYIDAEVTLQF